MSVRLSFLWSPNPTKWIHYILWNILRYRKCFIATFDNSFYLYGQIYNYVSPCILNHIGNILYV